VRDAVVGLRRRKSMVLDPDDPNRRSAGSFFTNPIVDPPVAEAVVVKARALGCGDVPQWAHGSQVKLAAGWLIEKAGFPRGTRAGAIGSSSKHGLALVHHGGGTTAELLAFARSVQDAVFETFGVTLEREPRLLGHL
jgi:UDP-N-acetylmuramate dehydrogenase